MEPPAPPRTLAPGATGDDVKRVQEWLTLSGHPVPITAAFDAATAAAVAQFRHHHQLGAGAEVDAATFAELLRPLDRATARVPAATSLAKTVLAVAELQLSLDPLEVGGPHCGPWVRLYLGGKDGPGSRWCAGFVSWCVRRAAHAFDTKAPFVPSQQLDILVADGRANRLLVRGARAAHVVKPGHVFLLPEPSRADAWCHAGIVRAVGLSTFDTIEGNSSASRPVNGDRVMSRKRAFSSCDFLVF